MHERTNIIPTIRKRFRIILAISMLALWASCSRIHLQQGWNDGLGPVIPHDTFPADCTLCHVGDNWRTLRDDFTFDHEKETGVALTGAHEHAQCLRCHNDRGPVQTFAAQGCRGCHIDVHMARLGPNCESCHTDENWRPTEQIAQHNRTRFPLIGAHAAVDCVECHAGADSGIFLALDVNCATCHIDDYQRTQSPNHMAAGLGTNCQDCHVPVAWQGAGSFAHPSSFPLTNAHGGLDCAECHTPGTFGGLSTACASCHLADFQATTTPNHAAAGFSMECQLCHRTTMWVGAMFNHPSSFPLNGGHSALDCAQCHVGNVYAGLSPQCVNCHLTDYQGTTDPNHVANSFSTSCELCHTINTWDGAVSGHPASFPLMGGHGGLSCTDCHVGGIYTGLSPNCASCHLGDYQSTTDPNHVAAGFNMNCQLCHNINAWEGAMFTHTASFPLTNGHSGLSCTDCHMGNVYTGLTSTCVSCHLADYQGTNSPNHASAGFPTDCTACHNTSDWGDAVFNHSFPITSGAHSHFDCNDCHTTPGNYTLFSCIDCHEHNQSAMANDHDEVGGYVWSSPACLACHPNGHH